MNTQELFDKMCAHLIKQDAPSILLGLDKTCAYRGENGTMCAIGCLIDDKFYTSNLEGRPIYSEKVRLAVENSIGRVLEDKELKILEEMQRAHDYAAVKDSFRGHLWPKVNEIAQVFKLNMPELPWEKQ